MDYPQNIVNISILGLHFETENSTAAFSQTDAAGHVKLKWGDWEGS